MGTKKAIPYFLKALSDDGEDTETRLTSMSGILHAAGVEDYNSLGETEWKRIPKLPSAKNFYANPSHYANQVATWWKSEGQAKYGEKP